MGQLNDHVNVEAVTLSQSLPATSATTLSFDLLAFRTLDPPNCCTDTLNVIVDGAILFIGAFSGFSPAFGNLDGPAPRDVRYLSYGPTGPDSRRYQVSLELGGLVAGLHTFEWHYSSLQDFTDEAWGLDNVLIDGEPLPARAVSTPAASALLASGLLTLGALRRRKA